MSTLDLLNSVVAFHVIIPLSGTSLVPLTKGKSYHLYVISSSLFSLPLTIQISGIYQCSTISQIGYISHINISYSLTHSIPMSYILLIIAMPENPAKVSYK